MEESTVAPLHIPSLSSTGSDIVGISLIEKGREEEERRGA